PDDPETDPITEEKAIEYAEAFLDSIRTATAYSFVSAEYMDTGMYYEITYVFPVFTYKTDDIMRIWVTADGRVSSFSEFMYGRYDSLKTSSAWCNGVESAKTSLQASIAAALTGANYSINDYYLTYNDDGDLEVVAAVSCSKAVETGINTSELLEFKQSV
ncbi:MAG: hypothetical protein IJM85_03185, partial [Clostridia bacterium]|nr:hypothetical protein [Clostridia bacterium]